MLTIDGGAQTIRDLIASGNPFFVGRNGTIELQVLDYWSRFRSNYPAAMKETIGRNAGVFPATDASLDRWSKEYLAGLASLDVTAAGWYEPLKAVENEMLETHAPKVVRCPLRSLEPYYVAKDLQWTHGLSGKKVAVVSSFTETIQKQLQKDVWPDRLFPTDIDWSFVRTGYAPSIIDGNEACGWPPHIHNWEQAADHVVGKVLKSGATIALIGCGGLGMILGARLRAAGISAIVIGGAIQVLFGIKGKRWANHDIISKFWNDKWVWPASEEVPTWSVLVEGGCYW